MIAFAGTVWRIVFATEADKFGHPVASPEGRFHHSGQPAIYTSLTATGCAIAIRRYLRPGDPPRVIAPLSITTAKVADLRDASPAASVVWQDTRAAGHPAPTWALSDAARADGAQALLYRSRSRPDLTHLTIFDPTIVTHVGPAEPWAPGAVTD